MSYTTSIAAVNAAQKAYFAAPEGNEKGEALVAFLEIKAAHRAAFGFLERVDGEYI